MLHPFVLTEMLDDEIAVAEERLGDRVDRIMRDGTCVAVPLTDSLTLKLEGARYDAEPFRISASSSPAHAATTVAASTNSCLIRVCRSVAESQQIWGLPGWS